MKSLFVTCNWNIYRTATFALSVKERPPSLAGIFKINSSWNMCTKYVSGKYFTKLYIFSIIFQFLKDPPLQLNHWNQEWWKNLVMENLLVQLPLQYLLVILNFSLEVFSLKIANFLSDEPSVSCKMVANNLQGVSGSHSPKEDPFLGNN